MPNNKAQISNQIPSFKSKFCLSSKYFNIFFEIELALNDLPRPLGRGYEHTNNPGF